MCFFYLSTNGNDFFILYFLSSCLDNHKINIPQLFISAVTLALAMFFSFLALKVLPKLLYGSLIERSGFETNFITKLNWFLREPVFNAINNYNISPSIIYIIISSALLIVGFFYILKLQDGILKLLLTLLLVLSIAFTILVSQESWAAFRSSIGVYLIVGTIIVYGLIKSCEYFLSKYHVKILLSSLLVSLGIYTQNYIYNGFIKQQQFEYQALSQAIGTAVSKEYKGKIKFDLTNHFWNALTKIHCYDEIGVSSIQTLWALKGLALSIKQSKRFNYSIDNNVVLQQDEVCKDNCIIIKPADILKKASMYLIIIKKGGRNLLL